MKVTHTGVTPPTGRRSGIVFNTVALTNVARAVAAPLQPRTAIAVQGTLAVSAAAALWNTLSPSQQSLWINPYTTATAAYAYFIQQNTLCLQWGLPMFIVPPPFLAGNGIDFATVYAEPDGIHTTLVISTTGAPLPGNVTWCRLYLNYNQTKFGSNNSSAAAIYAGSFALTSSTGVNFYDFTDLQTALAGQWWHPRVIDTAAEVSCGNNVTGYFYATNQDGILYDSIGQQPQVNQACGVAPPLVMPGICPVAGSPPFPWPTAAVWYA
jgi:hypothetical protein